MDQTRWVLTLRDGTIIDIPANKIADINKKIQRKEPIKTDDRLILYQDIASGPKKYEPPVIEPDYVEQAAIAFNEPIYDPNGNIKCVWVKQEVSANRWNKYYASFASFFKLYYTSDHVTVAYRLPIHELPTGLYTGVQKCTPDEIRQLENKLVNS